MFKRGPLIAMLIFSACSGGNKLTDTDTETETRVMFEEDFNSGSLPEDWSQDQPNTALAWEHSASEGVGSSGAALARITGWFLDQEVYLQTPFMDLSSTTDLRLTFELAMANRGDTSQEPDTLLSVLYDNGNGWTLIDSYGSTTAAENEIGVTKINEHDAWSATTSNYVPVTISDLHSLSGLANIRFSFGSHVGSGDNSYMFIDDVVITEVIDDANMNDDRANAFVDEVIIRR